MAIGPGARVGPYEVTAFVGEGGMGKVWRAHHTALKRDDALKVLPDAFATDPERMARFQREAQVLASLNHKNIAHVYGLETADGVNALVMELVEGPTLAEMLAGSGLSAAGSGTASAQRQGSKTQGLPLDEALPIARQIAEALEAAHEQGIIHRDLKPANIKVRADGVVKILDFGLAKALGAESGTSPAGLSNSPTMTSPVGTTGVGILLGTAAYMAPEQARGRPVDKRADIWSFGCVLFEMLTGRCAFEGEDLSLTLAAVMKSEPDWSALGADVPGALRTVLQRCLQKDPTQRFRDAGDVRLAIDDAVSAPQPGAAQSMPEHVRPLRWRVLPWAVAVLLSALAGSAAWKFRPEVPAAVGRFEVLLPNLRAGDRAGDRIAFSPDGDSLVYVEDVEGRTRLVRRQMSSLVPGPIAGTEGVEANPFFSPDSAWVGFVVRSGGSSLIKKAPLGGGAAGTVCELPSLIRSATWLPDGNIIFESQNVLWRVAAAGGTAEKLPNVERAGRPQALPGGRAVLITTGSTSAERRIEVLELATGQRRVLALGEYARYLASGHLLLSHDDGSLWAAPFSLTTLTLTREPTPLPISVRTDVDFAVSANGSLVFMPGGETPVSNSLVWVQRDGTAKPAVAEPGTYQFPRLSPDGRRLAVGNQDDLWVLDLERSTRTRLTFGDRGDPASPSAFRSANAAWTPDGKRLAFTRVSRDPGRPEATTIEWANADGSDLQRLTTPDGLAALGSWSGDGKALVFHERPGGRSQNRDLWMLHPGAPEPRSPFLVTPFNERAPVFSPNGRWIAYVSNESGRDEVYVRPYSGPEQRVTVSSGGGTEPVWARNGRELFYREGDRMMVVSVSDAGRAPLSLGPPQQLFEGSYIRDPGNAAALPNYDVNEDGRAFLMIQPSKETTAFVVVVLNWFEELKRLVPTN